MKAIKNIKKSMLGLEISPVGSVVNFDDCSFHLLKHGDVIPGIDYYRFNFDEVRQYIHLCYYDIKLDEMDFGLIRYNIHVICYCIVAAACSGMHGVDINKPEVQELLHDVGEVYNVDLIDIIKKVRDITDYALAQSDCLSWEEELTYEKLS